MDKTTADICRFCEGAGCANCTDPVARRRWYQRDKMREYRRLRKLWEALRYGESIKTA